MYRIMLVEDDDKIAAILEGYIEKYGYQALRVHEFRDVKKAFLEHRRVNVTRVRKKLEAIGIQGAIDTVRGQGYRLTPVWGDSS